MPDLSRFYAPEDVKRWRSLSLGIGGILSIVILGAALISPDLREQALRSWLLGFVFWGGIGIGCIGVLLLQYLTGGAWGVVSRRILEAGARTLPVIFILFIPLAIGVATASVFSWTHMPADDHVMQHRGWYMTSWGWIGRSIIYFVLLGITVWYLESASRDQDAAGTAEDAAKYLIKASRFSGPTMVIYSLIVTFAAVDWVMMLDPHFFSTIFGMLFIAGWALSCFCFVTLILALLSDSAPMSAVLGKRHFHDLGKLMLALVMVWAYFNFSQFLIIWSGNIPEETVWFLIRMKGVWGWIGAILIFFHFAFPFLVLLHQNFKRKARWLATLAIFILVMRVVDMLYLIGPTPRINAAHGEHGSFIVSWLDIVGPLAVGGIWLWAFFGQLISRPIVPANDPYFEPAIEHGRGH
jgi:NADH:ubiquinone oxidoreductase subunit 6 (subunit J)